MAPKLYDCFTEIHKHLTLEYRKSLMKVEMEVFQARQTRMTDKVQRYFNSTPIRNAFARWMVFAYYENKFYKSSLISKMLFSAKNFRKLLDSDSDLFSNVSVQIFDASKEKFTVPNDSVDAIVTFRNIHGWVRNGKELSAFQLFYKALKPDGILGVVQHRANIGTPSDTAGSTGYVSEKHVISVAEKAGFFLEARSEINANPRDTKNYEKGVWTLPPSLRLGDRDKERYLAIGESDRMTLKFRKPNLQSSFQNS